MTSNNTNTSNDDYDGDGIDWDALAADVRAQAGLPLPAEVAPGADALDCDCGSHVCLACALAPEGRIDIDPEADAELWPPVLDAKGRPTGELARPNPTAMRAALDRVAAVDPAEVDFLANAVSEAEVRAIIAQAARQREHERRLEAELAAKRTELAAESARRQAEHEARVAEARRRRENRAERALERRSRALDPTGRIVRLAAAERVVPLIVVAATGLAAVLGAVNVGIALDKLSPDTQLINWLVEPLVTIPLLAILTAQVLGAVPSGDSNPYRRLEWVLIAVAVGLNGGLHLLPASAASWVAAAVWVIVPGSLATSAALLPRLIRSIRESLAEAEDGAQGAAPVAFRVSESIHNGDPTGRSGRVDPNSTQSRPMQVSGPVKPKRRTDAEIADEFADAIQTGRIDEGMGRPMDPTNVESIRRTLGIRAERARALRDQYRAAMSDTE